MYFEAILATRAKRTITTPMRKTSRRMLCEKCIANFIPFPANHAKRVITDIQIKLVSSEYCIKARNDKRS